MNDAVNNSDQPRLGATEARIRELYVDYLSTKLSTAFSLTDWYEQEYGSVLSDDEVDAILGSGLGIPDLLTSTREKIEDTNT